MRQINTREELLECNLGQHILRKGKEFVYAGVEYVSCGSVVCSCGSIQQLPVILSRNTFGKIERIIDPPFEDFSYTIILDVEESDLKFKKYKTLLDTK